MAWLRIETNIGIYNINLYRVDEVKETDKRIEVCFAQGYSHKFSIEEGPGAIKIDATEFDNIKMNLSKKQFGRI